MKPASTTARRGDWLVPSLLLLLALVPSVAGGARVADLARGGPITEANARFMAMPLPVLLHLLAAVPFGMVGAFQFSAGLRRRAPRWHRAAGWLPLPPALLVALTGLWRLSDRQVILLKAPRFPVSRSVPALPHIILSIPPFHWRSWAVDSRFLR